jgi:ribosomal protein S27AE
MAYRLVGNLADAETDVVAECGILAHGFLRLRCGGCGQDKLLAFS